MSRKIDAWACNRIFWRGEGYNVCTNMLRSCPPKSALQRKQVLFHISSHFQLGLGSSSEFAEFMSPVNIYSKIVHVPKEHRTKNTTKGEKWEAMWVRLCFFNTVLDFCASDPVVFSLSPFLNWLQPSSWRACIYVSWDLKYWQKLLQNQKGGVSTLVWNNFWSQKGQFLMALCC